MSALTLNEALATLDLSNQDRADLQQAATYPKERSLRYWATCADSDRVKCYRVDNDGNVSKVRGVLGYVTSDDFEVGGYTIDTEYQTLLASSYVYVGVSRAVMPGGEFGIYEVAEYIIILPY